MKWACFLRKNNKEESYKMEHNSSNRNIEPSPFAGAPRRWRKSSHSHLFRTDTTLDFYCPLRHCFAVAVAVPVLDDALPGRVG